MAPGAATARKSSEAVNLGGPPPVVRGVAIDTGERVAAEPRRHGPAGTPEPRLAQPDPAAGAPPVELELELGGFDAFFRRELPRIVGILTAVTGSRVLAEELAQEAMFRAHQRWDRISRYDDPPAWLRRVALNLAFNARARRRNERRALERIAGQRAVSEAVLTRDDGPDDFWTLVRTLPHRQAAAVALHYLEDRPVAEVAAILGCAEGTAKAHLHKGRRNLARLLSLPEAPDGP